MRQTRRRLLGAALIFAAGLPAAFAQGSSEPVPFYQPADVVAGLYRHWAPPRAAALAEESQQLRSALQALCRASPGNSKAALETARAEWKDALGAWERLAALPFGPLIERRSVRQIDFTPTRPRLIERAIKSAPRGAEAMERVGTPAKGFPALEWLLWTEPVAPGQPACEYAIEVADDLLREAEALRTAFAEGAAREWDEAEANAAFTEFLNQSVGAFERLRWQQIERPLREAETQGQAPEFPRAASASSADSWARQWEALRTLTVASDSKPPQPGAGVVPLDLYLRGRGHLALAERWGQSVSASDAAMRDLRPGQRDRLLAAAEALERTKRMAQGEVAPALQVSIGFSDSDGD